MATQVNPTLRHRIRSSFPEAFYFQRREEEVKRKKIQRRVKLKLFHILLFFLLLGGTFYSIQRIYLFLISWDNLNVKETIIVCSKSEVREEIQQSLKGKNLGNIFLLDIGHLQEAIRAFRWVEEVRVRKIFPCTLNIEIKERTPFALLKKESLDLIDRWGVELEKVESEETMELPVLIDSNEFQKDFKEKLKLAWECLSSLSPSEKNLIEVIDLTDCENITVQLKNDETRLVLGNDQYSAKLKLFAAYRAKLEKFGELEYADLRFPRRLYFKLKAATGQESIPSAYKEAH
jgi:cell division septal protein FtsQ